MRLAQPARQRVKEGKLGKSDALEFPQRYVALEHFGEGARTLEANVDVSQPIRAFTRRRDGIGRKRKKEQVSTRRSKRLPP